MFLVIVLVARHLQTLIFSGFPGLAVAGGIWGPGFLVSLFVI